MLRMIDALLAPLRQGASHRRKVYVLLGQSSNAPNPFGCSILLIDTHNPTARPNINQ